MNFLQKFESDKAPKAIGPYSPAVKLGDFVYLSGQLGMNEEGNLVSDNVVEQTQRAMENIGHLLAEMGLAHRHIVKTTVFVTDLNDFNQVNEVYGSFFTEGVFPARSCIEVSRLPKDGKVEIECIVLDTLAYEQQMQGQGCGCSSTESCEEEGSCESGGCCGGGCH